MENKEKIVLMGKDILRNRTSETFSAETLENTLRGELAELVGYSDGKINAHKWRMNKEIAFEIMEELIDEIFPARVEELIGRFANVSTFADGDKPRFLIKKGKKNVRRFVTKVASAGVYDRVKLSKDYMDIDMEALGGAIFIPFNDFIKAEYTLMELLNIFLDELMNAIYEEVQNAIIATFTEMPANNKYTGGVLDATEMKKIINTVRAYGSPTIFCTEEFANTLIPTADFISDSDKETLNNMGYLGRYAGANLIVMPNSFTDLDNVTKVFNAQYAYIVPAGSENMIVNLGFEGQTHIKEDEREDWSMEMQIFKKYGIAILHTNFFGMYRNTAL